MKTRIKIIITVCAFIGVINANATENYEVNNSGLNNVSESLSALNEKIVSFESETNGNIDYQKEAQMITAWIADMAEARTVKNVMDKGFIAPVETLNSSENEVANKNIIETTDFLNEARIMTKQIADKEEAKAVRNVMERGFVSPDETIYSSENEVVNENINETTDFLKEARLMTKLIADQEEAKVVQNVMERGFVAPVEEFNSAENEDAIVDFEKEAQLLLKLIADKEEAKMVQKLIAEGKL